MCVYWWRCERQWRPSHSHQKCNRRYARSRASWARNEPHAANIHLILITQHNYALSVRIHRTCWHFDRFPNEIASIRRNPLAHSLFMSARTPFDIRMSQRRFFATQINGKKSFIYFQHALFQRTVVFVATINIQQRREIEYLRLQQQAVCDAHTATAAGEGEPGGGKKETCKLCCVYVIQPKFMASFDSHIDTVYPVSATHRS